MSKIEDKSIELIEGLEKLTAQYAPDVADAALMVVKFDGIGNLVIGLALSLVVFVCFKVALKLTKRDDYDNPWKNYEFYVFIIGAIGLISAISSACHLFNIWNYVAIFEPKLALAYQVFKGVF